MYQRHSDLLSTQYIYNMEPLYKWEGGHCIETPCTGVGQVPVQRDNSLYGAPLYGTPLYGYPSPVNRQTPLKTLPSASFRIRWL